MAGIYIHIPFCKSRCIYCGFYSTTALSLRQRYVDAVCREMELRKSDRIKNLHIDTIYLGGGTPTQLTPQQLEQLFHYINKVYIGNPWSLAEKDMEITIECNPDDVTSDYAAVLSRLPANRISMGVQTFDDKRLRFLHRRHTAAQVPLAVQRLREAGIQNISIDLMYGFPGETMGDWQRDIDAALGLNVEHLSAYSLMYEEGTELYEKMRNGENGEMRNDHYQPIDEELERQMYETLIDRLTAAGFEHYEISNFARYCSPLPSPASPLTSFRSRHNSSYWQDVPYIGLGAAAHSYDGLGRQWNVSDITQYMTGIEQGTPVFEREELDDDTRYNDRVTVGLRTCEGLCLDELSSRHARYLIEQAGKYIAQGLAEIVDNHLRLTRQGLFVSDMIMTELVWV